MSIEFRLLAVLYIVFQQTVRRAVGQNLGAGFCATGKCINCFSCNGECNLCECNTLSNSCCCQSPRGTYSTGYDQVPCPGGTYQSKVGSSSCLVCNQTNPSTLYWLTKTGAHSRLECQEALCDRYCDRLDEVTIFDPFWLRFADFPHDDEHGQDEKILCLKGASGWLKMKMHRLLRRLVGPPIVSLERTFSRT